MSIELVTLNFFAQRGVGVRDFPLNAFAEFNNAFVGNDLRFTVLSLKRFL